MRTFIINTNYDTNYSLESVVPVVVTSHPLKWLKKELKPEDYLIPLRDYYLDEEVVIYNDIPSKAQWVYATNSGEKVIIEEIEIV